MQTIPPLTALGSHAESAPIFPGDAPIGFTSLSSRRLGRTLSRYVVWELVVPTTIALVGLTALVLTKDLLSFSDLVINRGFGAAAVAWIAFYEVVPLVAYTLPFAVLIGALVGLGRLRADREILTIEAAGISSHRLLGPVLTFAAAMTLVGLLLTLSASPWASRSFERSLQQMWQENPGISLRPGTVHEFGGTKIVAREISARGDRLRGVLLWIPERGQTFFAGQTIFAERGELEPLYDGSTQLTLYDGVTLFSSGRESGETRFETFSTSLRHESILKQGNEDELAGVSLRRLVALAWPAADNDGSARLAQAELHRRFSYPAASLIFGLLAVPLILVNRRLSRAAGGVVGLLVTVVYYGFIQLGAGLAQADVVSLGFGAWLPNLAVGLLAATLLWREKLGLTWNRRTSRQGDWQQAPRRAVHFLHGQRYLLQRYVAHQYARMLCLSFALLLVGYLLVDVLERLQWFARYHADMIAALRFYGARLPLLASRVIPMSLLLATALTVSLLSVHREIIGMRTCGVSAARALTPILLIAGLAALGYFFFNEAVVPQTNALADRLRDTEIKNLGPRSRLQHMAIWYRSGTHVYEATQLDPTLGEARDISIYELNASGLPVSRTDALAAKYIGNGVWELVDPVRTEISAQGLRTMPADRFVQLGEVPNATVDTKELRVRQLEREIHNAEASGYDATSYRVDLHMKLAAPLACLLLPAVALFFAIGGPPFPSPALTLLISVVLGVGYVLLTGVCASLGYGGFLSPSSAGWGPPAILAVLASTLAARTRG